MASIFKFPQKSITSSIVISFLVKGALKEYAFKLILKRWLNDELVSGFSNSSFELDPIVVLAIAGTKNRDCKKFLR
jgi:hypothetical protein